MNLEKERGPTPETAARQLEQRLRALHPSALIESDTDHKNRFYIVDSGIFTVVTCDTVQNLIQARAWTYTSVQEWRTAPSYPLLPDEGFKSGTVDALADEIARWWSQTCAHIHRA